MKIYFAYRSAYLPNNRHLKAFEADSILDWFQKNWSTFCQDDTAVTNLLGTSVYGFPVYSYDDSPLPGPPTDFEDLENKIQKYIYSNVIIGDEECLCVFTDDDEIELAWFVFTENYKEKHPNKVELWFTDVFPETAESTVDKLDLGSKGIVPDAKGDGCVYFISCPIYDSENLADLEGVYRINGIRLNRLLNYLRKTDWRLKERDSFSYARRDLKFLQHLAKQLPEAEFPDLLDIVSKVPITNLNMDEFYKTPIEEFLEANYKKDEPSQSKVYITDHFVEIGVHMLGQFYNYIIIFDNFWATQNPQLARSLAQFAKTWRL